MFDIVVPSQPPLVWLVYVAGVVAVLFFVGLLLFRRKKPAKKVEFASRWGLIRVPGRKEEYRGRFGRVEIGVRFLREKSARSGESGAAYVQVSLLRPRDSSRYVSARARHLRLAAHRRGSLIEVRTGDAIFDGRFRVLVGARDDAAAILEPDLRAALTAASIGTFEYIQGEIRLATADDLEAMMNLAQVLCARLSP